MGLLKIETIDTAIRTSGNVAASNSEILWAIAQHCLERDDIPRELIEKMRTSYNYDIRNAGEKLYVRSLNDEELMEMLYRDCSSSKKAASELLERDNLGMDRLLELSNHPIPDVKYIVLKKLAEIWNSKCEEHYQIIENILQDTNDRVVIEYAVEHFGMHSRFRPLIESRVSQLPLLDRLRLEKEAKNLAREEVVSDTSLYSELKMSRLERKYGSHPAYETVFGLNASGLGTGDIVIVAEIPADACVYMGERYGVRWGKSTKAVIKHVFGNFYGEKACVPFSSWRIYFPGETVSFEDKIGTTLNCLDDPHNKYAGGFLFFFSPDDLSDYQLRDIANTF